MGTKITVVESTEELIKQSESAAHIFCFEEEIAEIQTEEWEDRYGFISTRSIQSAGELSLYQTIHGRFTYKSTEQEANLVLLTLLAERLNKAVIKTNAKQLIYRGKNGFKKDKRYEALVTDIAEHNNIETNIKDPVGQFNRISKYTFILFSLVPFFLDQIFSIVWKLFQTRPRSTETVFIPAIGRFDSMRPVIEETSFEYEIVIPPMSLNALRPNTNFSDLRSYNPIWFNTFSSVNVLVKELKILYQLGGEIFIHRTTEKNTKRAIEGEIGIRLSATCSFVFLKTFTPSLVRAILYYPLTVGLIRELQPDNIVVGTLSPLGRSIVAAAHQENIERYHVPHSVMTALAYEPPVETVSFVEGEIAREHVESRPYYNSSSQFVITGRPYLENLYQKIGINEEQLETDEPINIVIATQPYDIIETYLQTVAQAIEAIDLQTNVVIKIHPDEDIKYYKTLSIIPDHFTLAEENLYEHIESADIVVTVNSNVGLEGIVAGAACICVNFWQPTIPLMPYCVESPVPIFESPEQVQEFFENLTVDTLTNMKLEQFNYVKSSHMLKNNAAKEIVTRIEDK